ncbi:heparinase II/III family protein [Stieleria sp. TO1_6]|uniref:alginate lyase family protein n=1 Tax=Stieleria tagensis TaxID=2956795 RepID=UPI00209AACF8|nr:alginate lyase family protein [Stieleria tagensis]MCO8122500.1 heparinase II/III family protein [Stieleria tagensis]
MNAESIMEGKWLMLGHPFDLTGVIDWHCDSRTGFQWKREFYSDIPLYNLPGETDVKYPWELSRHQFLPELARDYQLNGSDRSAEYARELMLDWIVQNPLYEGVNWTSGLEVAMRAISWIWTLAGLGSWEGWSEQDLDIIGGSLREHAVYLAGNFSTYSSPYNHLIGEAAGLLCIATLFDEGPLENSWKRKSREVLLDSGPKQFYSDGFCVEQAMGYHYYTLGFLVIGWLASKTIGEPLDQLGKVIHTGFQVGASFRQPDGRWPAIGDLDSARAIPVSVDDYWCFDSLQNLAAVLFDDPHLKTGENAPGQELFWLTGSSGVSSWMKLESFSTPSVNVVYQDSGYAIGSNESDWMLFDAGSIAHGLFGDGTPSTAHGHADTLQVLYCFEKQLILNDGGMPYYGGDQDWVAYFRSPAAHNTIHIDGVDLVRRAGRLAWSHEVARPELEASMTSTTWLCRGTVQWPGVCLERFVCCIPGKGLWIADVIKATERRRAEWYWQLPNRQINLSDPGMAKWDNMSLSCLSSGEPIQSSIDRFDESKPEGWRCLGYGEKDPGCRLRIQQSVHGQLLTLTSIGPADRGQISVRVGDLSLGEGGSVAGEYSVRIGQCEWLFPPLAEISG